MKLARRAIRRFMKNQVLRILTIGFLSTLIGSAFADPGRIQERGTDRVLEFEIQNKIATFTLVDGEKREVLLSREAAAANDPKLDPQVLSIDRFKKSQAITEGYVDVTFWLVETLDSGIFFLPFITVPVYAGYTLSYLYTIPADLVSSQNAARRKYVKLVQGKHVRASKKVFRKLVDQLSVNAERTAN